MPAESREPRPIDRRPIDRRPIEPPAPQDGAGGARLYENALDATAQAALAETVRRALADAPLFRPTMPRTGKPFSVRMTNLGPLGWVASKEGGYRYQGTHPETGAPWPAIPDQVLAVWREVTGLPFDPEACLVNWYGPDAKMGLHRDEDEDAQDVPVVSISLGDEARFRLGGPERKGPTTSLRLRSGDVLVLDGPARRCFHGVDRIYPGTSTLLEGPGRINLTLRRVTRPG
ncbi:MAG: alpha-ketoglutarate-dependent dioxygenase AlkB [Marivibrio sp.]|uniref:alpha-ketoglutarate-dependent dioxygenase AlkB family protein n=1 Tax=Marivibrio sp. TaxID=2039719 RepID=UPI0032ECC8A0